MRQEVRNALSRVLLGVYVLGAGAGIGALVWVVYSGWYRGWIGLFVAHGHLTHLAWMWGGIAILFAVLLGAYVVIIGFGLALVLLDSIMEKESFAAICLLLGLLLTAAITFCMFYFYGAETGIIANLCSFELMLAFAVLAGLGKAVRQIRSDPLNEIAENARSLHRRLDTIRDELKGEIRELSDLVANMKD